MIIAQSNQSVMNQWSKSVSVADVPLQLINW